MDLKIQEIIKRINQSLKKANYETLAFGSKEKYCFDLLVKKADAILFIKIFPNIDNINPDEIQSIKMLSKLLKSKPVLIGLKNRYQPLDEDTVYIRDDLPFISLKTFEKILDYQQFPYILARRGGGVIFIDGKQMKTKREEKQISRKLLSEEISVAKRTVCSYENESMRPSQQVAEKIVEILEDANKDLFRKINVFEWTIKGSIDKNLVFEGDLNPFEEHLQNVFDDIGLSSYWYKKGQVPFKLSLFSGDPTSAGEKAFYPLFSEVSNDSKRMKDLDINTLVLFSQIFHKYGICIVNDNFKIPTNKNLPIIKMKNLEKIDDEEDFIEFIKDQREKK